MEQRARFGVWATLGLLIAGMFLLLLMLLSKSARAPSMREATPASAEATLAAPTPVATDEVSPAPEPDAVADSELATYAAPPELVATAGELQAQYESVKGELPEDVSKPLDDDIGVVEGAVADLLVAISAEPENESLKRMLVATYRNEVRLLKKALHLSSDPDPEDTESEATSLEH